MGYEFLIFPTIFFIALIIVCGIAEIWLYFWGFKENSIYYMPMNFQPNKIKHNNPEMDYEYINGELRKQYDKLKGKTRRKFLCKLYHINYFDYEYGMTLLKFGIHCGLLISSISMGIIALYGFL